MIKRHFKNKCLRILNKILIILIVLLLLFLLIGYLKNLLDKIDYLARYSQQQNKKIERLQNVNHSLESIIVNQNEQIMQLKHDTITSQVSKPIIHNEKESNTFKERNIGDIINDPITIITTSLVTLGGIAKMIVSFTPAIP